MINGPAVVQDPMIHAYNMLASVVGHLCGVLLSGPVVSVEEEHYANWTNLCVFSSGLLAPVPRAGERLPSWRTTPMVAAPVSDPSVTAAIEFVSKCLRISDDGASVEILPAGKTLYDKLSAKQKPGARPATGALRDYEVTTLCALLCMPCLILATYSIFFI
jgi:hypothetical protein